MRKFKVFLGVLVLAALVVPASAGLTEITTWNAQGLGSGWGLVSDGTTLYAFNGTSAKVYDAATDTWSALASATRAAYTTGDNNTQVYYADGKIYFRSHASGSYISIYDTANDSWTQVDLDLGDYSPYSHSQGTVYDPTTGQLWALWTTWMGTSTEYTGYNSYDTATGTWGAAEGGTWFSPDNLSGKMQFNNSRPGVIVEVDGTSYYYKLSDLGTSPYMQRVAFGWDDPTEAVTENLTQLIGNTTSLGDSSAWGARQLAVYGTDIYVTGGDTSGLFAVYHCDTNEWEILESYDNGGGGYRDHSSAVADGVLYVQDGSQYWYYTIVPEPATMALLGLGGAGLLVRRKR